MVAEPIAFVDVEGAVREWARDAVPSVERRVFFGVSDNADFPQIILSRIGGRDDQCLIQFDCWVAKGQGKAAAQAVQAELATAVDALARYFHEGVLLHGATVDDVRWLPDEEDDSPRYIVDATFTATPSNQLGS